ncbi:hypothetical protein [Haloferula sp. A504]|uniref:hypothetical protein n=1 Tax=Haloferula sp. A504 TaxID=3373601 RepID=UPI0031BBE227|nr:hypothetical protein [Verrucomicrobiaceae bacterium E54]
MELRVRDVLRLLFVGIAVLVGVLVALKQYRIYRDKGELVNEVRELTSEASFYRQFDAAGAESVLLRTVAAVEDARDLGLPPTELFDRVYERRKKDRFDYRSSQQYPVREQLVRRTLDQAHRAADELGLLSSRYLKSLRDGEMPRTDAGRPVILPLIDPAISPGFEKIVPNLEIHPPETDPHRELNAIQTAAARQLARDLERASLIEDSVADLILDRYKTEVPVEAE